MLVIGAGYTGLAAARETAAAGRSTLVLDGGALGAGCSSRNGGQVAYSIKPSFNALQKQARCGTRFPNLPRGSRCRRVLARSRHPGRLRLARERLLFRGAHREALWKNGARCGEPTARSGTEDQRRNPSGAAPRNCQRFLSRRLCISRRCIHRSCAPAARAAAPCSGLRRIGRGSLRGQRPRIPPRRI